jgi:hypothetical protein
MSLSGWTRGDNPLKLRPLRSGVSRGVNQTAPRAVPFVLQLGFFFEARDI